MTIDFSQLKPAKGARHKPKRVGRGVGSGHGTYATRGLKGQKSRSGGNIPPRFEGGQLPLIKRLPRTRGFTNIFRIEYAIVKVQQLCRFAPNSEVTPESMRAAGLIKSLRRPVKILANGDIGIPLAVSAHGFTAQAKQKIEAAGGRTEVVARA